MSGANENFVFGSAAAQRTARHVSGGPTLPSMSTDMFTVQVADFAFHGIVVTQS
jgi:hypothetical protein